MKILLLKRKNPNNPQIQAYSDAVKKGLSSQHVLPSDGQWAVKKAGSSRASKKFISKNDAVSYAKSVAKNQCSELFIHRRDGRISERSSY